jgi:hypothetical protein
VDTPNVTPVQYGAGGTFVAVALACLNATVTGTDLLAYLASAALVTCALVLSDAQIRRARAGIVAAEYTGLQQTVAAFEGRVAEREDDA